MCQKCLLIVSVVSLLVHVTLAQVVWEFGKDSRDSTVIAHNKAEISVFNKVTHAQFTVPNCMKVNYVRVTVVNQWTTPAVTYNKHTNTVTISYLLLQNSHSNYDLVVKAKQIPNCGRNSKPRKRPIKKPKRTTPIYYDDNYEEDNDPDNRNESECTSC